MRKLLIGILLLVIGLFIQTAPAQNETVDTGKNLLLVGDIEAQATILVFPKVPGKVERLNVEIGDSVYKADMLAEVEHEELELGVRQARAVLKAAEAGFVQTRALAKINVTTKVKQAQAGLAAARATLDQVKDLSFTQTTTQIAQAEAGLEALKASMEKIKQGAREEERKQVEASVQQAEAGLNNARINYERMKRLFEEGAVSKQMLEGLETQFTVAEAQYEAASQQLKLVNEGAREEDIRAVEAQVKQAQAALQMAKKLEDTKSWEKDIALVEAQVSQAEAVLELAMASEESRSWEAEIAKAETAVEQARVALELAQKQLSDSIITAPISGIISRRTVDLGGMVSPQSPIFEIVDMEMVKAKVSVTEADLHKIRLGDVAQVSVDALQEPVEGEITLISPIIEKMTRTATVEISIDNRDRRLRPGMFARAEIAVLTEE